MPGPLARTLSHLRPTASTHSAPPRNRHRRDGGRPLDRWLRAAFAASCIAAVSTWAVRTSMAAGSLQSVSFQARVLAPSLPEAPFALRFFSGAVKTNSRGEIITGPDSDPV